MTEIDYDKLANAIAAKLQPQVPNDQVLWDGEQCASYLGVSAKHFIDRMSKSYGFPKPIKLPSETGRRAHNRWYAVELMKWVNQHRQAS